MVHWNRHWIAHCVRQAATPPNGGAARPNCVLEVPDVVSLCSGIGGVRSAQSIFPPRGWMTYLCKSLSCARTTAGADVQPLPTHGYHRRKIHLGRPGVGRMSPQTWRWRTRLRGATWGILLEPHLVLSRVDRRPIVLRPMKYQIALGKACVCGVNPVRCSACCGTIHLGCVDSGRRSPRLRRERVCRGPSQCLSKPGESTRT
jgi:hypothetical protein